MEYESVLPIGYRIEEYEIIQVLGAGGFGITYLGQDHHLDKPVAIKEYLPNHLAVRKGSTSVVARSKGDQADFDWGLDRFMDEARVLGRFDHPNLPKVHRFFKAHGTAYIVMEYIDGKPLDEIYAREGRLTERALKSLVHPLLEGLEIVHDAGYLHRDIKPSNIVVRGDGSPVLLDFGAARAALGTRSHSVTSIVTPGYAPLEQYSTRGDQGPWTDLYALAAVLYRGVTGIAPCDVTDRVGHDPLKPASELAAGRASQSFLGALDWALRLERDERPGTIQAWREALNQDVPRTERLQGTAPQTRAFRGKALPVVGVVLLLVLATLGAWSLQTPTSRTPDSSLETNAEPDDGMEAKEADIASMAPVSEEREDAKQDSNEQQRSVKQAQEPEQSAEADAVMEGEATVTREGWLRVSDRRIELHSVESIDVSFVDEAQVFINEQGSTVKCQLKADTAYICKTKSGVDLAAAILINGAARASEDANETYLSYQRQARESKRGIWSEKIEQ